MEFRKVARINMGGSTTEIQFFDLRAGDRFTLNDGEGDHEDGTTIHVALSDASPIEPAGNSAIFAEMV